MKQIALEVARNLEDIKEHTKYTGYTYRVGEHPDLGCAKGYRAHEKFVAFCAMKDFVAAARKGANWCHDAALVQEIPRRSFYGQMHRDLYDEWVIRTADAVMMYVVAGFPECPDFHKLRKIQERIKDEWHSRYRQKH